MLACRKCEATIEEGFKFCPSCGLPLKAPRKRLRLKIIATAALLIIVVLVFVGLTHRKDQRDYDDAVRRLQRYGIITISPEQSRLEKQIDMLGDMWECGRLVDAYLLVAEREGVQVDPTQIREELRAKHYPDLKESSCR